MEMPNKGNKLRVLSLNVDGLKRKMIDIMHYALREDVDIILIQEARVDNDFKPRFGGYKMYTLSVNDGIHGLVTFVKKSIFVEEINIKFNSGVETQAFMISYKGNKFNLINSYFPREKFRPELFPDELFLEDCFLIGDFNAKNSELCPTCRGNNNCGRYLVNFLNNNENVKLIGNKEPTHMMGGRLDYVCMFGEFCEARLIVSNELHSDHFAIILDCEFNFIEESLIRKRLKFNPKDKGNIMKDFDNWYSKLDKEVLNDVNRLNDELVDKIHKMFGEGGLFNKKKRTKIKEMKRWYNSDPVLIRIGKEVKRIVKIIKRGYFDGRNILILKNLRKKYRDAKVFSRNKYWLDFIGEIDGRTTSREVWNKIAIARGKKKGINVSKSAKKEAERLVKEWVNNSSFKSLPENIKKSILKLREWRRRKYNNKIKEESDLDMDFSVFELKNALKMGKSTAPGEDGVTYDIIRLLVEIKGCPLLRLFNIILNGGKLPKMWKRFLMIPIPRQSDPQRPRPISLGSCLSKTFERLVLNRIMFVMRNKFNSNMFGFLPGRGTGEALASYHSFQGCRYSVFLDLKSAFDKANIDVILYNLSKFIGGKVLGIIKDFLRERIIRVFNGGHLSKEGKMDLGTPQGGVLSPTLFNILMMPLSEMKIPDDTKIVIYADDVLIQSKSHEGMKMVLRKMEKMCVMLGLVISEEKTKAIYMGRGVESRLMLNGKKIEFVKYYKYLGNFVGHVLAKNMEMRRIVDNCRNRMRPMRALAMGDRGVNATVLRRMYIGFIRPIIDHAASTIVSLGKLRIRKIEAIQNEALRIVLGVPKTVRIDLLRRESGIESVQFRVNQIVMNTMIRILSDEREHPIKNLLVSNNLIKCNQWVRLFVKKFREIKLLNRVKCDFVNKPLEPWLRKNIDVRIVKSRKKSEMISEEERPQFLEMIHGIGSGKEVFFTDGSLGSQGKAGAAVVGSKGKVKVGVRLGDDASSTQTELFAILLALKEVVKCGRSSLICSDSQAALLSVNSRKIECNLHNVLVSRIHVMINKLFNRGIDVNFLWVPSHIGIEGNEMADSSAKEACEKEEIDYDFGLSRKQCYNRIFNYLKSIEEERYRELDYLFESVRYYNKLNEKCIPIYFRKDVPRYLGVRYVKIKTGYRYTWEFCKEVREEEGKCKICKLSGGHNLNHYILCCPMLDKFRSNDSNNLLEEAERFLDVQLLKKVCNEFKDFVRPY